MSTLMVIAVSVCVTAAILLTISTLMRLADLERRVSSCERSVERLASVWWEGMSKRYPSPAEPTDNPMAYEAFKSNFPD